MELYRYGIESCNLLNNKSAKLKVDWETSYLKAPLEKTHITCQLQTCKINFRDEKSFNKAFTRTSKHFFEMPFRIRYRSEDLKLQFSV